MILLIVLILLSIGFIAGYKVGQWYSKGLNTSLQSQVDLLTLHSKHWAQEASNKYQLSEQVSIHQTKSTSETMHTIIQLLSALEQQQSHASNTDEQRKISHILNQAKSLALHHERSA